METYSKRMKNLWQNYWKPMKNYDKPTKTRKFEWFYCILRGAKRRGEKMSGFTVYYAVRSAAAKI